jgi:hypothetical protein
VHQRLIVLREGMPGSLAIWFNVAPLGQTYDALHVFFFAASAMRCHANISSRTTPSDSRLCRRPKRR